MQFLDTIIGVSTTEELAALMNRKVQVGQNTSFVVSYLDRASCNLYETVPNKFSNDFFAGLPDSNLLSSNARNLQSKIAEFARRVEYCK